MRRALTAVHVGLIPSENCQSLLDNDVENIKLRSVSGNPIERYCFRFSVRWLRYIKEFSISHQVFSEQFLEPARSVARFRLAIREDAPYSMTIKGLIFLKSPQFYDKAFGVNVCSLAVLVPELGSVLTIRCRKEQADATNYGEYSIHGIQPIPFVNRMHPTKLEFEPLEKKDDIFDSSFLKLSFKDIDVIDRLLAFENFCEMWSEQIYDISRPRHGRRLGTVGILGGKIMFAGSGPFLTIQDPCNSESACTFFVSQRVLRAHDMDLVELSEVGGKIVKFMALFWYRYGSLGFTPPYPEIVQLKFVNEKTSLIEDDLIGHVRLRGKIDLPLLGNRYASVNLLSPPKPLTLRNNRLIYDFSNVTENRIAKIFLEQKAMIRLLREKVFEEHKNKEIANLILPEQILNEERLRLKGMAEWIFHNKPLLHCLLALLMKRDLNGELPLNFKEFITAYPNFSSFFSIESYFWLKYLDLIKTRKGKAIQVTPKGEDVAYLAIEELIVNPLKKILLEKGVIDFVGLETKVPAPPSILLKSLQRLKERGAITSSIADGVKCELFWLHYGKEGGNQVVDDLSHRLELLQTQVIAILNSVHCPLHTLAVLERIREKGQNMNYPALVMILSRLANQKRIVEKEPNFWFYPLKTRVADLLKANPMESFTVEEIAQETSLAPMPIHLATLQDILQQLEHDLMAEEVIDHQWSFPLSIEHDRGEKILRNACRKKVLAIIETSPIGQEELLYEIVSFVLSTRHKFRPTETSLQIASLVISEMIKIGEIIREGNLIIPRTRRMKR